MKKALSWDYKTNSPCRLGKKIIVSNILYRWRTGYVSLDHSGMAKLDDLARPFWLLDGRNVPDFRESDGARFGDFIRREDNIGQLYEGEYFTIRAFLKGTVHIMFRRPDLVDRLNDIIARHFPEALPPRV